MQTNFSKGQLLFTAAFVALFLILYFGFDTKSQSQKLIETSRAVNQESTDVRVLIDQAKPILNDMDKGLIKSLENELASVQSDTLKKLMVHEKLASAWFELSFPEISGYFAEEIAKAKQTEESWAIAGTTFAYGLKKKDSEKKVKDYCYAHAMTAFENAISIQPDNIDHRINQALVNTDHPPANNPMKGILQLVELNQKFPNNVKVLSQLGRLAMQTNQFEKAIERFTSILAIDNNNIMATCGLADAYDAIGNSESAVLYINKCKNLNK